MKNMRLAIFITLIFVLGALLRFVNLSSVPPSLSHDEVAIGYNAYSIAETGKDEFGNPFPMLFRSFDDYKLPGYIYSASITMSVFGVNEFSVRFPSALFGSLTVLIFYFLVSEFLSSVVPKNRNQSTYLPIIAMLMLAISPWHIDLSRVALETNASLFFMVLTFYFLLLSRKSSWFLVPAAVFSVTSVYFYYTARVVMPILILVFLVINGKKYLTNLKAVITSFIFGFVLVLPLLPYMFSSGLARVNQVSIFNDKSLTNPYSQAILRHEGSLDSKIIYNRRVAYLQQFSTNYLKNFAPDFYFTNGNLSMGLLYLWEIPFFVLGVYVLIKLKSRYKWAFVIWFLSVPILGGLTVNQPNTLRTLPNVIPLALFTATGLYYFFSFIKKRRFFICCVFFTGVVFIFSFVRFLYLYFDYIPHTNSDRWKDGHKQMVLYAESVKKDYDTIYISGELWRPYIYFLFYSKYPPSKYQLNGTRFGYDKYIFTDADWDIGEDRLLLNEADLSTLINGKTLFILSRNDFKAQESLINSGKREYKLSIIEKIDGRFNSDVFYAINLTK